MKKTNLLKILPVLAIALISLVPLVGASDAVPSTAALRLDLLNQDPDPVSPGNFVELRWTVTNVGYTDARDVVIELLPSYPFSLAKGTSAIKEFSLISANPDESEGAIVYYKLYVDENAVEGVHEVTLRYKLGNNEWRSTQTDYDVRVRTEDTYLSIDQITSVPSMIAPGQSSSVTFKLTNKGDTTITNAKLNLDFSSATIPLTPTGSSNEKMLTKIDAKKSDDLTFEIAAEPEAAAGLYSIPLTLSYDDVNGDSFTSQKLFSLVVGSEPDISVTLDNSDILTASSKGKVTLRFVNKGVTDIKFLNVILDQTDDFEVLSSPKVYIGNIDSDDFETADFDLHIGSTDSKKVILPITYEYRDANNKAFTSKANIELRLYSKDELKEYGFSSGSSTSTIVIVLVVIVLGFFVWRHFKKKRK